MKNKRSILSLMLIFAMVFTMMVPAFADTTETTTETPVVTSVATTEQVTNVIDILTVNDFHGSVKDSGKNIGMAKMVGYINDAREVNPNTLVVSAGDNYQGSAISNLTFGAPVNDMFKGMGLIASAVGNHEFDWGVDQIAKWSEEGGFPYLAANIYDKATNQPVTWAKPYIIQEVNGLKVAFIGLSTVQTAYQTKVENVQNLEFKTAEEAAKIWVEYLQAGKDEQGTPDVIVALTHVPSDQQDGVVSGTELEPLTKVEGIDAIITGHSHRTVAGEMNGVPVVQAYKNGRSVGKISITLNEDKTVKSIEASVDAVYKVTSDLVADQATSEIYDKYDAEFEPIASVVVGKIVGELTHDRSSQNVSVLGYWSCDVMRKATDVQIGLTNGGGLRRTLEEGDVTMGDMYEVMPYDNTLVTMTVTGEVLKQLVDHGINADYMTDGQFAGLKVTYNPDAEYENRIVSITLEDGTPIEMDKEYTLVTNDFIYGGGDKYDFSKATNVVDTFVPIRDVLVEAFKADSPVQAPVLDIISPVKYDTYTIILGDVLWKIAQQYGMTYEQMAEINKIENPHMIYAGKTLLVPSK